MVIEAVLLGRVPLFSGLFQMENRPISQRPDRYGIEVSAATTEAERRQRCGGHRPATRRCAQKRLTRAPVRSSMTS